ncbi:superinfection exclusion B family protein [Vibrio pacinii]|uniref:superinfection exclusion B family protein n=1 Tax=Vibrio pacinii TaxID=170674 RepID=UPI000690B72D|nr:superinfection exclusion B family protein [Vibrio pacinii]
MFDPKQIFDWVKLSGKQAFILSVITSILLFASDEILGKLGVSEAINSLQIWIGLVWLVSVATLAAEIVFPIYGFISKHATWYFNLKGYQKRLHQLTVGEKQVLSQYIRGNTRTISLNYSDGIANELESAMIIRRASNLAHYHDVFPFNIQPWAWDYLSKHPELLN